MSESKFTLNPYDLDPNEDLVHTPVDVENWTEGFFFFGHDGARGISFVIHFAMVIGAPGLWQASVEVGGLPNDQVLVTHTRGRSATKTGPGTGPLQVTSIEPMRSWRIEFDGALELTTRTALLEGGLHQPGQPVPVRFEFTTTAAGPFWSTTAGGASLAKEVTDPPPGARVLHPVHPLRRSPGLGRSGNRFQRGSVSATGRTDRGRTRCWRPLPGSTASSTTAGR